MTLGTYRSSAHLLDELGICEPAEIDVEAIAQHCGATVVYDSLHGCGARLLGSRDRAIITVDNGTSIARQRFSAGHELGHWMRDRHQVVHACAERVFREEWARGSGNPEQRANRFAAELLLPAPMFKPLARGKPITFSTVDELAEVFRASWTATALRLVEIGPLPAMLVCSTSTRRKWFTRGEDVKLWPREHFSSSTVASELFEDPGAPPPGPTEVCADGWIDHPDARRYPVVEDSRRIAPDLVLSLIWWKDEAELLDLAEALDSDARSE